MSAPLLAFGLLAFAIGALALLMRFMMTGPAARRRPRRSKAERNVL